MTRDGQRSIGFTHRIERRKDHLRVHLEVPLGELLAHLGSERYQARLQLYLGRILSDLNEVGKIILSEPETGVVKWFDEQKGYGFIRAHDSQDVFVHWSGIAGDESYKTLKAQQRVQFKRRMGRETFEAIDVIPCDPDESQTT